MFSEYPKWLRHDGHADVLVENAAAEADQLALWAALPKSKRNALLPQLDHDGNGEPGGSLKPAGDIADLRATYKEKFGKRAFPGWNAEELKARLDA